MHSNSKINLPTIHQKVISHDNHIYELIEVLGEGGYGTVFKCIDETRKKYALKVEKLEQTALKIEIYVLHRLNEKKCRHFCKMIDWGNEEPDYMFMVMTLLGADLSKLRSQMPLRRFSLGTALRLAMQTANALQELHTCGFISRDVKPGNFAHGINECTKLIYMVDFGLARKYMDKNMHIIPERMGIGWRGTIRYGSLRAHAKQDLARKDDLESWIYMVIEFTKGVLPWRLITDRTRVQIEKEKARTENREMFLSGCPPCFNKLLSIIDVLQYPDEPPYQQIISTLIECCNQNHVQMKEKYDWETENVPTQPASSMSTTETETALESPHIPVN